MKVSSVFKLLLGLVVFTVVSSGANAQSVIRGEVTPGVYQTFKITQDGALYTTPDPATVNLMAGNGVVTDRSGTIVSAGVSQQVAPVNPTRKYFILQNTSDTEMWVNLTTAAGGTGSGSIRLIPNASFVMENKFISIEPVNVMCAVAGKSFAAKEF